MSAFEGAGLGVVVECFMFRLFHTFRFMWGFSTWIYVVIFGGGGYEGNGFL